MLKEKIEEILWDYLMDCLAIHHLVNDREVNTVPEAQDKFSTLILSAIKDSLPDVGVCFCDKLKVKVGDISCPNCLRDIYRTEVLKRLEERMRKLLEELVGSHKQPCDCLLCRKGGRIDTALSQLKSEILGCVPKEQVR